MSPTIFTLEVDATPIVTFEAKNFREANELVQEDWFRGDLLLLMSDGKFLWDGKAPLRTRIAIKPEIKVYREIAAEEDTAGDMVLLAFLASLDDRSEG